MNFEERENARFASWEDIYDYIVATLSHASKRYVFLDEVQMVPNFEKLVDALYVKKDIDLYVTGSNAYLLSSELSTLLSGRHIAINLHPFSFSEYVAAFPDEHDGGRLFRQYMNASCFPEAVILSKTAVLSQKVCLAPVLQLCKICKYINISVRVGTPTLILFNQETKSCHNQSSAAVCRNCSCPLRSCPSR